MSKRRSLDPMAIYMREVGRHPLLTAQEEIACAIAIAEGDEYARQKLINANLRLVVKVARQFMGRGLPLADLVEEGNIGLMRAVEKFDIAHGCRFSTYAIWWIRQAVERGVMNQARTIRLPVHVDREYHSLLSSSDALRKSLGREPTKIEIADSMGNSNGRVQSLLEAIVFTESADEYLHEDGFTLYDVTEDESVQSPPDQVNERYRDDLLLGWLNQLSEREQVVLRLRYGLDEEGEPWTLDAIGAHIGVTRERIRQIQVSALQKLRLFMARDHVGLEELI